MPHRVRDTRARYLPCPRQGQPDAAADHEAAGDARQQPRARAREEQSRAPRKHRVDGIGDRTGDHEGGAEQRHLRDVILFHVHELRNERAEEHQHFRVGEQNQKTLQEKPAARRRRRRVGIDAFDRDANQFDPEPDQIGGAGKAHPVEPVAHGGHQRGQADRDNADHDGKPRLHAGDVDQRRAGAVAQPVGDDQRDHRPRQQRQRDAGDDEGEIDLEGHGIFHRRHGRACPGHPRLIWNRR